MSAQESLEVKMDSESTELVVDSIGETETVEEDEFVSAEEVISDTEDSSVA